MGNYTQTAGTTTVNGTLIANTVSVQSGTLAGSGMIQANVVNAGSIGLGAGREVLTIKGNFTQAAGGVLDLAVAGNTPGTQYDQLNVTGTAILGGTLNVAIINAFVPAAGTSYQLMMFGTHTGKFTAYTDLPPNSTSTVNAGGVVLSCRAPTAAELAIAAKYQALGGAAGVLGPGTTAVAPTLYGGGIHQRFQNGDIAWSAATGAHDIYGPIATEFFLTGSEKDAFGNVVERLLGLPIADQTSLATVAGAQIAKFQGGTIYGLGNSAHVLYGAIAAEYATTAGEADAAGNIVQTDLGLPTSDEVNVGDIAGGRVVLFQGGAIYWGGATGAHAVYGFIAAEYAATANESDAYGTAVQKLIGLPTRDETNLAGFAGARIVPFQAGNIYWSAATGAHVLYGAIAAEYAHTATERLLYVVNPLPGASVQGRSDCRPATRPSPTPSRRPRRRVS